MKYFRPTLLITPIITLLPTIAHANMGPVILLEFRIHLVFLTWIIGLGEGLLLCAFFRAWKIHPWRKRIFISMIAGNITSALLGMLFIKSRYAAQIMGDVTIENLIPAFWTMVYVTFVLTMIIEFPFFLTALYGRKWLIPKTVAATIFVHCISYSLLFFFYLGEDSMNMVTELEVVPASTFEMKEDYNLYYISPDGKNVLRSDLAGKETEVIATLDMDGIPDRLCACPRKVIEEIKEGAEKGHQKPIPLSYLQNESDLYVLMYVNGAYKTNILFENFSPSSALKIWDGEYEGWWDAPTEDDYWRFRSFGDAERWEFSSIFWAQLLVFRVGQGHQPYTSEKRQSGFTKESERSTGTSYWVHTPFVQWPVRNGTHIAGDYGVFLLGKDQICIMDPEKKRIALIARGFGPVVAKPPLEEIPEAINEQTVNEVP